MNFVCLDVEGVLLPELWISIAAATGVSDLSLTTRDVPDFDALMRHRCELLDAHAITYVDILSIVKRNEPLSGALEFLAEVRRKWPCALISDSFYEFLLPLAAKLGLPTIFSHNLVVEKGRVTGWRPRLNNQKPQVVRALQELGFTVFAAGDSFNDLGMIEQANHGFLVNPPHNVRAVAPSVPVCNTLEELLERFRGVAND